MNTSPLLRTLFLGWELGYSIAIPIVVFALLGRLADKYFASSPVFLLVGIALSIVTTTIWLARKAKRMLADIEKDSLNS